MIRTPAATVTILAVLAGCSGRVEENSVNATRLMTGHAVPPIDREAPERFETATFAVG